MLPSALEHQLPILCEAVIENVRRRDQGSLLIASAELNRAKFHLKLAHIGYSCVSGIEGPISERNSRPTNYGSRYQQKEGNPTPGIHRAPPLPHSRLPHASAGNARKRRHLADFSMMWRARHIRNFLMTLLMALIPSGVFT